MEVRTARKEAKRRMREAAHRRARARTIALRAAVGLLFVGGGAFAAVQALTAKVYPPTGMQDHVESYPSCQICPTPIPESVQRHIMEHRPPGRPGDRPGILVQYSCTACPDVVATLTRIVERYPKAVYLAPYPAMSPRIALTTLGQVEVMEEVEEARIVAFIEKHL